MRRPLTVRWWFRAILLAVVLLGGYTTAYAMLREIDVHAMAATIEYPCGKRMYAMRGTGCDFVGHYERTFSRSDPDGVNGTRVDGGVGRCESLVYCDSSRWYAPAIRVFYPAERLELWWRGIDTWSGDDEVAGE